MASSFKGSDHIESPDRKRPSYGDCLESGGWHMALVGEELATDTMLDEVQCVCSGRRPVKTCMKGLAYKGPSCSVVAAESSMNFSQKLPPLLFGDTSLKDSGSAFLIKLSLVDLVGFRVPHYVAGLVWSSGSSCLVR